MATLINCISENENYRNILTKYGKKAKIVVRLKRTDNITGTRAEGHLKRKTD